jgi:hypothetical protein
MHRAFVPGAFDAQAMQISLSSAAFAINLGHYGRHDSLPLWLVLLFGL